MSVNKKMPAKSESESAQSYINRLRSKGFIPDLSNEKLSSNNSIAAKIASLDESKLSVDPDAGKSNCSWINNFGNWKNWSNTRHVSDLTDQEPQDQDQVQSSRLKF